MAKKKNKAQLITELLIRRRLLGLYTEDDHFNTLTVPILTALLVKFQANKYSWLKRDYIDWIICVRIKEQLSQDRWYWDARTIKELKVEKARLEDVLQSFKKAA